MDIAIDIGVLVNDLVNVLPEGFCDHVRKRVKRRHLSPSLSWVGLGHGRFHIGQGVGYQGVRSGFTPELELIKLGRRGFIFAIFYFYDPKVSLDAGQKVRRPDHGVGIAMRFDRLPPICLI